jgi:hypothetical protein
MLLSVDLSLVPAVSRTCKCNLLPPFLGKGKIIAHRILDIQLRAVVQFNMNIGGVHCQRVSRSIARLRRLDVICPMKR